MQTDIIFCYYYSVLYTHVYNVQYAAMERHLQEKASSDFMWQVAVSDLQKKESLLK